MRNGKAKKNSSKRVSRENPSVVTNIKISRGFTDRKNLTLTNDEKANKSLALDAPNKLKKGK